MLDQYVQSFFQSSVILFFIIIFGSQVQILIQSPLLYAGVV